MVSDAALLANILFWRHACHLAQALDLRSVHCLITADDLDAGLWTEDANQLYAH